MSSSKAKSKSKWFHCFKVVVESKQIGVKKENISCGKLDLSDDDNMVFPLHDIDHGRRRRKRKEFRCGFSRIVKDVFFQTSAAKKRRSIKFGEQVSSVGGNSIPSSSEGSSGHSSHTSLFSSSPSGVSLSQNSSSFSLSNLSSPSERKPSDLADLNMIMMKPLNNNKKKNILVKKNGDHNAIIGLCFLVVCLVGLVFSGKSIAILCTAACLFLFHGAAGNSSR